MSDTDITYTPPSYAAEVATLISAPGVAVYREGEPNPSGNVHATFEAAAAAVLAIGEGAVWIDPTLGQPQVVAPTNLYNRVEVVAYGVGGTLIVRDGANLEDPRLGEHGINIVGECRTAPALIFNMQSYSDPPVSFFDLTLASGLKYAPGALVPMISVPDGEFLAIRFRDGADMRNDAAPGLAFISMGVGSTVLLIIALNLNPERAAFFSDTVIGDDTTTLIIEYDNSVLKPTFPRCLGTVVYQQLSYEESLIPSAGNTASRPASPSVGQRYFDTDLVTDLVWSGSAWESPIRPGVVIYREGEPNPSGNVYNDVHAALAAAQAAGILTIAWDGSLNANFCVIPDGSYDIRTAGMNWIPASSNAAGIMFGDASFQGLPNIDGIYVQWNGTAPAFAISGGNFQRIVLTNDATIDASGATAPFVQLTGASINIDLSFGGSYQPGLTSPFVDGDDISSLTMSLGDNATLPNNSLTGDMIAIVDIYGGGASVGATQTGATALTVTNHRKSAQDLYWNAGALVATTGTTSTMAPGYAAATLAGIVDFGYRTRSPSLANFTSVSVEYTGSGSNTTQTMTFKMQKNGSDVATISGIATTSGTKTGTTTGLSIPRTSGDKFTVTALPSTGLGGNISNIEFAAGCD